MKALRVVSVYSFFLSPSVALARNRQPMRTTNCPVSRCCSRSIIIRPRPVPTFTLDEVEQMALAGNPEIRVAARRLAVVEANLPAAGALDDPSFMYRGWQVPLRQPWNYNAAQNMFMLSQTLPGSGKRGLRTDVAEASVTEAKAALEATAARGSGSRSQGLLRSAAREDELRIHDEHIGLPGKQSRRRGSSTRLAKCRSRTY